MKKKKEIKNAVVKKPKKPLKVKKVKTDKEKAQELYDIWSNDLQAFVEDCLSHYCTSAIPNFHSELYKLLPHESRLALAAPRGFAKSQICSMFYPLWCALFKKRKNICIISASEMLAVDWLRKIKREIETNDIIIKFFGDLRSGKWSEGHIILSNGCELRAKGGGGQIRGFRPDLMLLDDIETEDSVASKERRDKLRDWIFKACLNTLLPHGQFIWIGTIISPVALLEEMLTTDNGWHHERFQAYIDAVEEEGYELWADLWNHKRLQARKKEIGSTAFASEYLNNPIANEAAPIKQHQIRNWETLPTQYSAVIAVDPAYSEDARADFKVASLIGIDHLYNRYLISYIRTHAPSGEFMDSIINLYLTNKHLITAVGLPKGAGDTEFFNGFMAKCTGRGIFPPVVELKNAFKRGSDKVIRKKKDRIVASLQPIFEAGKYYIHKNHTEAVDELLNIGYNKNDDITDTMSYAEQILVPGYEDNTPEVGRYGERIEPDQNIINDYGY